MPSPQKSFLSRGARRVRALPEPHSAQPPEHGFAANLLTTAIAAIASWASLGGLVSDSLYRDNAFVRSAWRGSDLVTLWLAVPVLIAGRLHAQRGSARARLVWLGALAYMLYDYAFYLFGAAFNEFFLLYAALVSLSSVSLIRALLDLDAAAVAARFRARTPVRWIASFMLLSAFGLGSTWIALSLSFVASGELPQPIVATEHPTSLVFALDLTLLVPALATAGVWLWRRRAWGYVLGTLLSVMSGMYTLGLAAASIFAANAGVASAADELALWLVLAAGNGVCALQLLRHLRPTANDAVERARS